MPISFASIRSARVLRRATLFAALVFASASLGFAQVDGLRAYRLEEVFPQLGPIIEKAMQQSPQMLQKASEITLAEGNYLQARSSLLPRADGLIYYATNTTSVSQGSSASSKNDGIFYSMSLYQPLFQWGTLKAQTDYSRIAVQLAEKNYAEAYRLLAVSVRQHYLTLIVRKASLKIAADNLRVAQAALDVELERLRSGSISEGEAMGPRLAVDEARLAFERAEHDLGQARRSLSRLSGQPEIKDDEIPSSIPISQEYYGADRAAPQLDFFGAAGVDDTLPLQMLHAQLQQTELNYKIAKFRLFPKLALVGSISQSNTTNATQSSVSQVGVNSQSLNVQATWSIFDGFATSGAKMSALASKRSTERQIDAQRRAMLDQARDLEAQLRLGSRAVRLADTRRYLAEDLMKRADENLRRGVGTQKDLDLATASFNSADINAMGQRADLLTRWAEFISLTGGDALLARLPARYSKSNK